MTFSNRKLPERPTATVAHPDFKDALTQFLEPVRGKSVFVSYGAAVRHFVHWLRVRRISLCDVDVSTVDRFARHKCSCPRYRPEPLRNKEYIGRVRRFVRFLEDRGYVSVPQEIEGLAAHLSSYKERLSSLGYHPCARRILYSGAEHFAAWLRVSRLAWEDINEDAIARFVSHDCRCGLWRKTGKLAATGRQKRRRGAQRFLSYLKAEAALQPNILCASAPELDIVKSYRFWLKQHCGAADTTVDRYLGEMSRWLPILGQEPSAYTARVIRDIVLQQSADRKPASIRTTATVLRSLLRFLAASNQCSPALMQAVPVTRIPRLSGLPRYAPAETIEKIIDACSTGSPVELRDRAIITLLARLGLRAGDIRAMRLGDIDWANGLLTVHGKGRRSVTLPLPQDAGDAILDYLDRGRPLATNDYLFLRASAPYFGLVSSSAIAGIISRVLDRAGITSVPTGAHMFRHSLATALLRRGGSLETIGTVLRHKSPETTAIYAKVDVDMLMRVAQPWPEARSC
jgi:site-specific recombinase XerD